MTEPKTQTQQAQAQSIDEALRTFLGTISSAGDKLTLQIAEALTTEQKPPAPEPKPCPKCGAPWVPTAHLPEDCAGWKCGSQSRPRGFSQTVICDLHQLRAAVDANGRMNGGWPVVVGETAVLVYEFNRSLVEATIASVNQSGQVELVGAAGWVYHRKPSELWHTREEAEAAMGKGGENA